MISSVVTTSESSIGNTQIFFLKSASSCVCRSDDTVAWNRYHLEDGFRLSANIPILNRFIRLHVLFHTIEEVLAFIRDSPIPVQVPRDWKRRASCLRQAGGVSTERCMAGGDATNVEAVKRSSSKDAPPSILIIHIAHLEQLNGVVLDWDDRPNPGRTLLAGPLPVVKKDRRSMTW